MDPTIDRAKIHLTMNVDAQGNPSGGGGGGGDASASNQVVEIGLLTTIDTATGAAASGIGSPSDTSWSGTGNASLVSAVKSVAEAAKDTSTINVAQDTSVIKLGTANLVPKFAAIGATGSADLVSSVSGKKIRVLSYNIIFNADSTAQFQSGGSTNLTGAMPFKTGGGMSAPFTPVGHFETAAGAKLNLVLGTSVAWAGHLTYVEV